MTRTQRRLELLKAKHANWRAHAHAPSSTAGQWQRDRAYTWARDRAYYCDNFPSGMRDIGDSHDIVNLKYTGWYENESCDELTIGHVLQLPAKNGIARYIPAMRSTGSDGVTLWPLDMYEEKEDAARVADRHAELHAEREREYSEAWRAGTDAREARDAAGGMQTQARALLAEMKAARKSGQEAGPEICAALRNRISQLREDASESLVKFRELSGGYYGENKSAFDEGFSCG